MFLRAMAIAQTLPLANITGKWKVSFFMALPEYVIRKFGNQFLPFLFILDNLCCFEMGYIINFS